MSLLYLMEPVERGSKYRCLSAPVIVVLALIEIGLFFWFAISLPWWVGLPAGVALLAAGFLLVLKLVSSIVPKKFPTGEDS